LCDVAVLCSQPGIDMQEYLSAKSDRLMRKASGSIQPHVLVLSETPNLAGRSVVYAIIQANLMYEVESVLEAVTLCIKAAFVFGLQFPVVARSSWTYVQQAGFGIRSNDDFKGNKLMELVTMTAGP